MFQFIILVIDSTDRERLTVAKQELHQMLAHQVCSMMMLDLLLLSCLFLLLTLLDRIVESLIGFRFMNKLFYVISYEYLTLGFEMIPEEGLHSACVINYSQRTQFEVYSSIHNM